jgi:hypothetical protein
MFTGLLITSSLSPHLHINLTLFIPRCNFTPSFLYLCVSFMFLVTLNDICSLHAGIFHLIPTQLHTLTPFYILCICSRFKWSHWRWPDTLSFTRVYIILNSLLSCCLRKWSLRAHIIRCGKTHCTFLSANSIP